MTQTPTILRRAVAAVEMGEGPLILLRHQALGDLSSYCLLRLFEREVYVRGVGGRMILPSERTPNSELKHLNRLSGSGASGSG